MINFTYMGTKRLISDEIVAAIDCAPSGPFLDLFAGMAAIGIAILPDRNVWCNDVQVFAQVVSDAYFTSERSAALSSDILARIEDYCQLNVTRLSSRLATLLSGERVASHSGNIEQIQRCNDRLLEFCRSEKADAARVRLNTQSDGEPYRLFAISYAGGFFGLQQAIEIDSIRFAIDRAYEANLLDIEQRRWSLIALCRALARAANSSGHFAQYLAVKERTLQRFIAKRRRSIWSEWQKAMSELGPLGSRKWRKGNRVFRYEAIELLKILAEKRQAPAVIYADPPYTKDQYSRYYHLWETLILYDYPAISSKAGYRGDRFTSDFSLKAKALSSLDALISASAMLNATLILSYPDRGLIGRSREVIPALLRQHFAKVEIGTEIAHRHSTLGASKGIEKSDVVERVYLAHR